MPLKDENRVRLYLWARPNERRLLRMKAKLAGISISAWIYRAISEQLTREGEQPLAEYPADTKGGDRRKPKLEGG